MALLARLGGALVRAEPGLRATCPSCGRTMLAKCGRLVVWHWAHEAGTDCDPWSEPESAWHLGWKARLLAAGCAVEVPMVRHDERHRADVVLPNGRVVELQHRYLSAEAIATRERFYGGMVWLYDAERWLDRVWWVAPHQGGCIRFKWLQAAPSMLTHRRPLWWHYTDPDGREVTYCVQWLRRYEGTGTWGEYRRADFVAEVVGAVGGGVLDVPAASGPQPWPLGWET